MKTKLTLIAMLVCITFTKALIAQSKFEVPQNVVLETEDDRAKYENDIIAATNWFIATPLDKEIDKRKQTDAFIADWVGESTKVNIMFTEEIVALLNNNEFFPRLFMAGFAKHCIENKYPTTFFEPTKAGLLALIEVYKKNIAITKNAEMDKLIKYNSEKNIDKYIIEVLKIEKGK